MLYKKVFENLVVAVAILLYFLLISFANSKVDASEVMYITKYASLSILFLSIAIFEIAYKKDNGIIAITGIEFLVIAIYTLTMWTVVIKSNISIRKYIFFSSLIVLFYYMFKSLIISTIQRKKIYDGLSDIEEIVKQEPLKKEARRRE